MNPRPAFIENVALPLIAAGMAALFALGWLP